MSQKWQARPFYHVTIMGVRKHAFYYGCPERQLLKLLHLAQYLSPIQQSLHKSVADQSPIPSRPGVLFQTIAFCTGGPRLDLAGRYFSQPELLRLQSPTIRNRRSWNKFGEHEGHQKDIKYALYTWNCQKKSQELRKLP